MTSSGTGFQDSCFLLQRFCFEEGVVEEDPHPGGFGQSQLLLGSTEKRRCSFLDFWFSSHTHGCVGVQGEDLGEKSLPIPPLLFALSPFSLLFQHHFS